MASWEKLSFSDALVNRNFPPSIISAIVQAVEKKTHTGDSVKYKSSRQQSPGIQLIAISETTPYIIQRQSLSGCQQLNLFIGD